MKKGLPKELAELAKSAKFLREWARNSAFHPEADQISSSYPTTHSFTRVSFERRRAHYKMMLDNAENNIAILNNFFNESGYPQLSKNNSLVRAWSHKLMRLRDLSNRKRRTPTIPYSKGPAPNWKIKSSDVNAD